MRRCRSSVSSVPLAGLALLLLICLFHCAAAARPLLPVPVPVPLAHHENGAKVAADDEPVIQKSAAGGSGDELSTIMGAEDAAEGPACEEGNDECMQRRLLRDAHLDYIYTQHKGKP